MLIGSFLLVTMIMRMAMWHLGYRIFTQVRECFVLHLRTQFFSKVSGHVDAFAVTIPHIPVIDGL